MLIRILKIQVYIEDLAFKPLQMLLLKKSINCSLYVKPSTSISVLCEFLSGCT